MHYLIAVCLACGIGLLFQTPVFSQDAGASDTTEEEEDIGVLITPYLGLRGDRANRVPHKLCDRCFTVPKMGEGYRIFESVPIGKDAEHLITRQIANPAPLAPGEVRPTTDSDGEKLWYIGTQGYSGPQDTEIMPGIGKSYIEVKRVRFRHQHRLLAFEGAYGVGISATGIAVTFRPGSDTSRVPSKIEGIPVEVIFQNYPKFQGHYNTKFRPVPVAAGIVAVDPFTNAPVGGGTLGPHITVDPGACCQVWSLTAAHVVRDDPEDPVPLLSPLIPIYQPDPLSESNLFGHVTHLFQLISCGTTANSDPCEDLTAPVNRTDENPDIASIDGDPYNTTQTPPYNTPTGTDPIRRMYSSSTSYINGPSGKIRVSRPGHTLVVWGAYGGKRTGQVKMIDDDIVVELDNKLYRMCCMTKMAAPTQDGDSGSAVIYGGTGKRHVAGVHVAGDSDNNIAYFIPSDDIKTAFEDDDEAFEHYWGTKEDYRKPATTTCDPPGC